MEAKTDSGSSALDTAKLVLALAILIGGIVAYYYYTDVSNLLRFLGVLAATVLAIFVAMQTEMGRNFWQFTQGARVELRKVIWPNRQETVQTTIAVIIFTITMGVFFWMLDSVLLWLTTSLTGRGG